MAKAGPATLMQGPQGVDREKAQILGLDLDQVQLKATTRPEELVRTYTELQKKLITSSEWRSLNSEESKWIIFVHR